MKAFFGRQGFCVRECSTPPENEIAAAVTRSHPAKSGAIAEVHGRLIASKGGQPTLTGHRVQLACSVAYEIRHFALFCVRQPRCRSPVFVAQNDLIFSFHGLALVTTGLGSLLLLAGVRR